MASVTATTGSVEVARPLIERAEHADGSSPISDQALLAVSQGQRKLLLFTEAGQEGLVAVGVVGQGEIDLVVDPEARSRGIGAATLDQLLGQATGEVLAWAHGENPAANALLERAGFTPSRSLFRMTLDPALLPPSGTDPLAVTLPDGYSLHAFGATGSTTDDAAAWVRVNAAAFADHPEQGRVTEADFALMREEPWFDADDLFLLTGPGAQLAGSTWIKTVVDTETAEAGHTETELYAIGVDPAHAGRGLGRILLDATLARMTEHHPNRVTLYVDGENERAVRMYEAAGFTIDSRSMQWRRVPE